MTQNIYDDPAFFQRYSQLPRSVAGLDGAPEWPALRAMLPPLHGLRVLDLGCGFGWFCRWAAGQGAVQVTGVDVSRRMLERAREATSQPEVGYVQADLETVALPPASFDAAYSSLALHYVAGLPRLLAELHRALRPGAALVFSVEHPIFTAPSEPGFVTKDARSTWPVDRYLDEGPRATDWLAPGVIKQHRMLGTYLNLLLRAGFAVRQVEEWGPSEAQVAAHPEWAAERERPPFLLVAARSAVDA